MDKNKKKIKKTTIALAVFLTICLTITEIGSIRRGILYLTQKPTAEEIENINLCYDIVEDCSANGFNKENAEENKAILKKTLDCGINTRLYLESEFNGKDITFDERTIALGNDELQANCYRDMIVAVYLMCVLETEPQDISNALNYYLDSIWVSDTQFSSLLEKSGRTKDDYITVTDEYTEFAQNLKYPDDRHHAYAIIVNLYNDFNNNNPDDKFDIGEKMSKMREAYNDENYIGGMWYGYSQNTNLKRIVNNDTTEHFINSLFFWLLYIS